MMSQRFAVSKIKKTFSVKTYADCVILFIISTETKVIFLF